MIIKAVEISCFMHIVIFADVHFFNSFLRSIVGGGRVNAFDRP